MNQSRLVPTEEITRQQTRYIDTAIDDLSGSLLLSLINPDDDPQAIQRKLQEGRLAYLNPRPRQPLYLPNTVLDPNPRYRHQQPAIGLLDGLQRLRPSAAPPPTEPAGPDMREALYYDPDAVRPVIHPPEQPVPCWLAHYRDALWYIQEDIPVKLEPSAASAKQDNLDYLGRTPTVRQVTGAQLRVRFFPRQGDNRPHLPKPHHIESERFIAFDGNCVEMDASHRQPHDKPDQQFNFILKSRAHRALILFPALGTPALVHPGQKTARLILAVDNAFHAAIQAEQADGQTGPMTLNRLYAQLRLHRWKSSNKRRPGHTRLYPDWATARQQMSFHALGPLSATEPPGLAVRSADGRQLGILHAGAVSHYREAGYTMLYQIDLANLAQNPGLYNLVWHIPGDEKKTKQPPSRNDCYTEPEDQLQQAYLDSVDSGHKIPAAYFHECFSQRGELEQGHGLYAAGSGPDYREYPAGSEDATGLEKINASRWQESRHPLYIGTKADLNPGQLSDVHISSRQQLYPQTAPQIIPGAGPDASPPLGQQAHNNAQAFNRLLSALGNDAGIDLLLLTGDLYDHVTNADPNHPDHQAIDSAKKLWDALDRQHHEDPARYPRYIDALKALSTLHDFLDTFQKPVFFVDGNHEAYETPYGISPRYNALGRDLKRLNPGIPADHGLTFFEAVLQYGPDYGHYGSASNFTAANLAWIHQLITPWRDWAVSYGDAQTFIGLGWGDDESFIKSTLARGGSLPRASQSCSDDQLALVKDAVDGRGARQNLLLSHFTHVNYDTRIPLNRTARIDPDDASATDYLAGGRSKLDQGSFHKNRDTLYEDYLQTGRIHYTFSGHSHRAGAYQLESEPTWTGKIPTRAHYPHEHTHTGTGACLLVTGAGGPLSWQNREGEYQGWGMEPPQGLKLDTGTGRIEIVHDKKSRPRMAVVLDYLWYLEKQPALQYPLIGNGSGFRLKLSEQWVKASMHGGKMLHEIRLHLHTGGKDGYQGFVALKQSGYGPSSVEEADEFDDDMLTPQPCFEATYAVGEEGMSLGELEKKVRKSKTSSQSQPTALYFLSLHLKQIETGPLHDHYDYDSPWCFPVAVETGSVWSIKRVAGTEGGEVPDFNDKSFEPEQLGASYGIEE